MYMHIFVFTYINIDGLFILESDIWDITVYKPITIIIIYIFSHE